MKLHFFKEEALNYFKDNIKSNINYYSEDNNKWIFDQFENPFEEIEINCKPFKLYVNPLEPTKMDLNNIKILYPALKDLTESQACDERLWSGLAHSDFYEYTKMRWSHPREVNNMKKENYIQSRLFYSNDPKAKTRHTIAKLWWLGKMLYDENNLSDPLHFVDTLGRRDMTTRINDVFTSNFSRNIHLLRPFLNVVDDYEKDGKMMNQDYFRSLVQYLNILGGMYLLDFMDEQFIETKLKERIIYYDNNGADVVKGIKKKRVNINSVLRVFSKNNNSMFQLTINEQNISIFLNKKIHDVVQYKNDELKILLIY